MMVASFFSNLTQRSKRKNAEGAEKETLLQNAKTASVARLEMNGGTMRRKRLMAGLALVACLGAGRALLRGQTKESDPVKVTPHMYQVRLENAYVRVLEYRSEPGEKEAMHFHPPGVVYSLSDATMVITDREGHTEKHTVKAGEVSWRNKTWHAAENVGTTEIHALAIELKMPLEDLK
jgi:beta-alanine degradation protein BauB